MSETEGFLVVLKTPETYGVARRQCYQGVDRLPSYRLANQVPIQSEIGAMNHYVFGDLRDEVSGLIPSHEAAVKLLREFRNSPREFELIWCRRIPDRLQDAEEETIPSRLGERLGVDVAGVTGNCWSIVADLPDDPRIARFGEMLNQYGLFNKATDASAYLIEYRKLKLHDFDLPFDVVEVYSVPIM